MNITKQILSDLATYIPEHAPLGTTFKLSRLRDSIAQTLTQPDSIKHSGLMTKLNHNHEYVFDLPLGSISQNDKDILVAELCNAYFEKQSLDVPDSKSSAISMSGAKLIEKLKDAGYRHFYTTTVGDVEYPCVILKIESDAEIELIKESNMDYLLEHVSDETVTFCEKSVGDAYLPVNTRIDEFEVVNPENHQTLISVICSVDEWLEDYYDRMFLTVTDQYYEWTSELVDCRGDLIEFLSALNGLVNVNGESKYSLYFESGEQNCNALQAYRGEWGPDFSDIVKHNISSKSANLLTHLEQSKFDVNNKELFQALIACLEDIYEFKTNLNHYIDDINALFGDINTDCFREYLNTFMPFISNIHEWTTDSFEETWINDFASEKQINNESIHIAGGAKEGGVSLLTKKKVHELYIEYLTKTLDDETLYYSSGYTIRVRSNVLFTQNPDRYSIMDKALDPQLGIANHSPSGISVEGGSGSSQLALAIMTNIYGENLDSHPVFYQQLRVPLQSLLISQYSYQQSGIWTVTESEIRDLIETVKATA